MAWRSLQVLQRCFWFLQWLAYDGKRMIFWNPATKKHQIGEGVILWKPPTKRDQILSTMLRGFSYDAINDDYKVIIMTQPYMENNMRVMVYSLKGNSSRRVEDLLDYSFVKYNRHESSSGVIFNGSLHWVVDRKGKVFNRFILAFDLGDEKFC
ncbi:F-box/kelch-repeat protein At3g06240-like [Hevea brasiliensis]|uniref:F-box/kelch-repeat protein At3g06240-like n=1 Tax=Hevea brasiliensis TaxID=3981 RepID=UPI0025DCD8DD|nr:F-box/kelch-repeat protein At3g06240-like [Hevea brasiliensis]